MQEAAQLGAEEPLEEAVKVNVFRDPKAYENRRKSRKKDEKSKKI